MAAPAPAAYVVEPCAYYAPAYAAPVYSAPVYSAPVYSAPVQYVQAPQPYYTTSAAPQVVYVRPAPRPVVVQYARPVPVRQSGFGFSWNFFR